jgi:hypothetical protein
MEDGTQRSKRGFDSAADAEVFGLDMESNVRQGRETTSERANGVTVAEMAAEFLKRCEGRVSDRTLASSRGYVRKQILPALGKVKVVDLDPVAVEKCRH